MLIKGSRSSGLRLRGFERTLEVGPLVPLAILPSSVPVTPRLPQHIVACIPIDGHGSSHFFESLTGMLIYHRCEVMQGIASSNLSTALSAPLV
jgi:hypothetical protein